MDRNIKIYNPYEEDEYVLVNMNYIISITKLPKEEFIEVYSPNF